MTIDDQYIEHEVQIRVLEETMDCNFTLMQKNIDDRLAYIDYKINILIGISVAAILIPFIKIYYGFI
jgi:hypothetical protein